MNSFLWNYMMLHLTTDTLHDQIGPVADWVLKLADAAIQFTTKNGVEFTKIHNF